MTAGVQRDDREALQKPLDAGICVRPFPVSAPLGIENHTVFPVVLHNIPKVHGGPDEHKKSLIVCNIP